MDRATIHIQSKETEFIVKYISIWLVMGWGGSGKADASVIKSISLRTPHWQALMICMHDVAA